MKDYIKILIEDEQLIEVEDAQISNPSDELYELQSKYDVKISRSNKSDAVYVFKTKSKKMRIGHPINRSQNHLQNFIINVPIRTEVTKQIVEEAILKYKDRL